MAEVAEPEAPAPPPARKKRRHHLHPAKPAAIGSMRSEINVTPLVDVVLVLLIIFMVVTPMLGRGVDVTLPTTDHHDKHQDTGEQIIVSVAPGGDLYLDTDPVTPERLVPAVKDALTKRLPDGRVREIHVKADESLSYGAVRKVLERLHEAGAPSVALGTEDRKKAEAR